MTYVPPYPIVRIKWEDASSNSETWVNVKDVQEPEQVVTVGYLVRTNRRFFTVACSVSNEEYDEDTVGNTMTIPRGMVVCYEELTASGWVKKANRKPKQKREKPSDHSASGAPQRENRKDHGARADDDPQHGTSSSKA